VFALAIPIVKDDVIKGTDKFFSRFRGQALYNIRNHAYGPRLYSIVIRDRNLLLLTLMARHARSRRRLTMNRFHTIQIEVDDTWQLLCETMRSIAMQTSVYFNAKLRPWHSTLFACNFESPTAALIFRCFWR
jgi:hypothetical protein